MAKFLFATLILLASLALQFVATSLGYSFDLAFAALIAMAFTLDWRELLPLTLITALIINWQPGFSPAILIYAVVPLAVYVARTALPYEPLVGVPLATVLGLVVLVLGSGISANVIGAHIIILDVIVSTIWSLMAYRVIDRIVPSY